MRKIRWKKLQFNVPKKRKEEKTAMGKRKKKDLCAQTNSCELYFMTGLRLLWYCVEGRRYNPLTPYPANQLTLNVTLQIDGLPDPARA